MSLKPHTKSQLDNLAPEIRMMKHAGELHLPEYILTELWEQKNFFSDSKMVKMCSWSYDRFVAWYEESL